MGAFDEDAFAVTAFSETAFDFDGGGGGGGSTANIFNRRRRRGWTPSA